MSTGRLLSFERPDRVSKLGQHCERFAGELGEVGLEGAQRVLIRNPREVDRLRRVLGDESLTQRQQLCSALANERERQRRVELLVALKRDRQARKPSGCDIRLTGVAAARGPPDRLVEPLSGSAAYADDCFSAAVV